MGPHFGAAAFGGLPGMVGRTKNERHEMKRRFRSLEKAVGDMEQAKANWEGAMAVVGGELDLLLRVLFDRIEALEDASRKKGAQND
jgi:hypothetical protein